MLWTKLHVPAFLLSLLRSSGGVTRPVECDFNFYNFSNTFLSNFQDSACPKKIQIHKSKKKYALYHSTIYHHWEHFGVFVSVYSTFIINRAQVVNKGS
jgi:hypothetical protein